MITITNNLRHTACPLCSSTAMRRMGDIKYAEPLYFSTQKIQLLLQPELWRCDVCRSAFTQNSINEAEAWTLYKDADSSARWQDHSFTEISPVKNIQFLNRYLTGGQLLDFGANTGSFLDYAQKNGCITHAYEISEKSVEVLKQKGHVCYQSLENIPNARFDIIAAFDLVEHLYDVPEFLKMVHSKLKPNGILLLHTGNINSLTAKWLEAKWWYISYPEHIVFPSKKFLMQLEQFTYIDDTDVFANTIHESTFAGRFKKIVKKLRDSTYNGQPSFFADHKIYVLRKQ